MTDVPERVPLPTRSPRPATKPPQAPSVAVGADRDGLRGLIRDAPSNLRRADTVALQRLAGNHAIANLLVGPGTDASGLIAKARLDRMHDPNVDQANLANAVAYLNQQAGAIVTAFAALLREIQGTYVPPGTGVAKALNQIGVATGSAPFRAAGQLILQAIQGNAQAQAPPASVSDAVRALNFMEQEIATDEVSKADPSSVIVGTEFTFSGEVARHLSPGTVAAQRSQAQKRAHNAVERNLGQWAERAAAGAADIKGRPTITVEPVDGKAGDAARRITYTFRGDPPWMWYWVADIDEACYETQTAPSTIERLRRPEIQDIIHKHIFGNVPAGLAPDPGATGGGGHISLDLGTGFARDRTATISFETLLATLGTLQQTCAELQDRLTRGGGEPDVVNAPWLKDLRIRTTGAGALDAYIQLLLTLRDEVRRGDAVSVAHLQQRLIAFNTTLTNPNLDRDRRDHIEDPKNISHYHAVNVEHLAAPGHEARLELRDVPAQTSYAKLLDDLAVFERTIRMVRQQVKDEQYERLGV